MTPFALSGLLILVTSLSLGLFVFIKTPKIFANRLWAYFNFAVGIWGLGAYESSSSHNPESALFWLKIGHIGVITIPIFFLHYMYYFLEVENKRSIIFVYILGLIFLIALYYGLLLTHVNYMFNSFYYSCNPPFLYKIFFFLWMSSVIFAYQIAYKKSKTCAPENKNKIKYFFLSLSLGYGGGFTNFLPILGFNIYPYGNFLVAIFPIVMTYVILKYKLMDIDIIIRKSLIYSLMVTSITLLFFISVLISEHIFSQYLHNSQHITTSIITASLIALIFTPLKNKIQDLVDRAFFKATPIEMAQQNAQLLKEVAQSERLKSIAILASGMAHEIKNPLTPIKTFSEQLPSRLDDKEFLIKFSKIINKEVDRIDRLVQDLLNFAKPSLPHLKQTSITQVIEQTLDFLNNEIIRRKISLNISFENKNMLVNADPQQIKQALLNIFLNAIDAMPNGGTLTINTSVIARSEVTKQSLIIEITDTGCGINPKDLPFIFDPFFTKKDHGTGLGLSITHEIVKNHDGKIFAESKLGKGTTFKIELPLQSSPL